MDLTFFFYYIIFPLCRSAIDDHPFICIIFPICLWVFGKQFFFYSILFFSYNNLIMRIFGCFLVLRICFLDLYFTEGIFFWIFSSFSL